MSVLAALRERGIILLCQRLSIQQGAAPCFTTSKGQSWNEDGVCKGFRSEALVMAVVSANFYRTHLGPAFLSNPMKQLTMEATRDAHEAGPAGVFLSCQMLVRKGPKASLELAPRPSPASQCFLAGPYSCPPSPF